MKKRMTSMPHDAVFKRFLRHPETAIDFLTLYLPEAILQRCDFSTLELMQKHIRQHDLSGITGSLATLVMLGYTNRRQLRVLFHYMLQYGNSADPSVFLRRLPHYEERLMSIAQKLKQEGSRREALRIAGSMLQNGLDTETLQRITELSADELKPLHG